MLDNLNPKLKELEAQKIELEDRIAALEQKGDYTQHAALFQDLSHITKILELHGTMCVLEAEKEELTLAAQDPELQELAETELAANAIRATMVQGQLIALLVSSEDAAFTSLMVELRAGAGGEEAGIFVKDLFRMYARFCERKGWKCELIHSADMGTDSWRAAVLRISGPECFKYLSLESGVHRVQRIPATESKGRIQTSTVTVAVLPEPKEVHVSLKPSDYTKDTYVSGGPGGQHRNRTESAVRLVHKETGITVDCADGKSQHQNLDRALKLLRARVYEHHRQKAQDERAADRKQQIGSGNRSEKIRTYNYHQDRVTDHRLNQNFTLSFVLAGDLGILSETLIANELRRKLDSLSFMEG